MPETEIKRDLIGDLLVRVEISPSEIPAEELGEIVRMNITMTNTGPDILRDVRLLDIFPSGRLITWPRQDQGTVNVTDPYTGVKSDVTSAFLNGSLLRWRLDELGPDKSAILTMDVEILHPMDAGWKREFDGGVTASYEGLTYNLTVERKDDWPVVNITYPSRIYSGMANISWNLDRTSSFTTLNLYSPNGRSGSVMIRDTSPGKLYSVKTPLITPGVWKFNIEAGDGYTHRTENYTITVKSAIEPTNITAFSHTKVPRTSLVAAQAAAARKAVLVDLAKVPQKIDPLKEEEALKQKIDDLKLSPQYLMVVGDPGSMPFISTGIMQKPLETKPFEFEVYRDYRIDTDDDNYTETSTGRIMGLSVYDASQLMARTFAYDRLTGAWKQNALVISSPPLTFPQDPIAMSIRDYLAEAGLKVRDLRYEEASYQIVASQMDNGQNIVHFSSHGSEDLWSLSSWSKVDPGLDDTHVKQLTLAPQTTSAAACATSNLKGYTLNVSDIQIYVPLRLDDSIALAFIRAGAVNYIGSNSLSWIFVSDDHAKRFHQALIFENDTVGQALAKADNLYRLKLEGAEQIKSVSDYEEMFAPSWDYSVKDMLNQTAGMNIILGDPSFRPYLPKTPPLPYVQETKPYNQTAQNESGLETSITAKSDSATDWIYWIETDTTDGELRLNAPPALIGEVLLPKDADKIIVKENGRAVWHDEDVVGDQKRVMWPIVRPKLNETRTFQVEYVLIPGQVQVINVTAGWNSVSIYLQPKDSAIDKYLKNKPYRSVFSAMGGDWDFSMKDTGASNVTEFEPGRGYLIDSSENFTIELEGKPVEFPYRTKLLKGWNMIGVPINKTVDVNNITVNAEHKRYKYPEAVGKGIISAFIWSYNDGLGWSHLGENDTLEPGKAYLVEAMSECRLEFRE
ncbi:MAG: C25 family cysteine peptidase [Methanotrichaceae archaeon]|nr:C25 family cysteine peptidase [Methanotrichaceae archaeon]